MTTVSATKSFGDDELWANAFDTDGLHDQATLTARCLSNGTGDVDTQE